MLFRRVIYYLWKGFGWTSVTASFVAIHEVTPLKALITSGGHLDLTDVSLDLAKTTM